MLYHISSKQKAIVMFAVMSALFLFALDQLIITTALSKIVEEFQSFSSLSWIVTAYLLTSTIATPIAGKFSDMFGRRLVILSGVAIFSIASYFSGASQNIEQLIVWRAIQGIGGGIITANAFAIIGDLFVPRERGRWQGIFGAVFGIASVVGPLLGGFLTEPHTVFGLTTDWRWTLWLNVPVGMIVFAIIFFFMPTIKHEKKPSIDMCGSVILAIILSSIVLAADANDKIFGSLMDASGMSLATIRWILIIFAAIMLGVFIWVEKRVKEPILSLRFFENYNYRLFTAMLLLNGAAFLGTILYITQFNQQVFEASPTTAGLMLLPLVIGLSISAGICGQIMQRTGRYKNLMIAGSLIAMTGIFSLSFLNPQSNYMNEVIIMVVTGVGLGALLPTLNLAVQNEFAQKDLGTVSASAQLFRNLGSTIGTAIFGGILTAGIVASIGPLKNIEYIQFLQDQPSQAQKKFDVSNIDTDLALTLNTKDVKKQINQGFTGGLQKAEASAIQKATESIKAQQLPPQVETKVLQNTTEKISDSFDNTKNDFKAKQAAFSIRIINSFSDSLRPIFYAASGLMAAVFLLALSVYETELRSSNEIAKS